jgi:8-amino-7-oxononanoate synthase
MDGIEAFLKQREAKGLLRSLRPAALRKGGKIYLNGESLLDFSSNDYLGLSEHVELKNAAKKAIEKFGTSSSASRLLSGDLNLHHDLEERIAIFKGKQSALVFNSGYQANLGIISSLCKTGDAVFCDRLSHASILDGILLSGAKLFRFRHNDIEHLEQLLRKSTGKFKYRLIITESIFSMDGDKSPLREIVDLKWKYGCEILVDEAHATGIFGPNGAGVVAEHGLTDGCELIMGTFSKALGGFGAYLACSKRMRDYLVNACRSFIYSTALPAGVIAANISALDIVEREPFRRETLLANAFYFRSKLQERGIEAKGQSQIVPLIIGDANTAVILSNNLEKKGYFVPAIRPPTVPSGESRLRFSVTYHHNRKTLQRLIEDIGRVVNV